MKQCRRILPRFGLRSILVGTAIVAVICGGWIRQAVVQRDVSEQLEQIGAVLTMGDAPTWLRWLPPSILSYEGGHYFCPVVTASLCGPNIKNNQLPVLPLLGKLPSLKTLNLDKIVIRNESLAGLAKCTKVENLFLDNAEFTDDDLSAMPRMTRLKCLDLRGNTHCSMLPRGLPNLRELYLDGTAFSDEAMQEVGKLRHLETLLLSGTQVSDKGISSIRQLAKLSSLDLTGTHITGEHLSSFHSLYELTLCDTLLADGHFAEICKLPNLVSLNVADCRHITEAGLRGLASSSTLENLDLTDCRSVSHAGLEVISRIPSLRNLKMDGTGITSIENLAHLQQLNCVSLTSKAVKIDDLLGFANHFDFRLNNSAPFPDAYPQVLPFGDVPFDCIDQQLISNMAGRPRGYPTELKLEGIVGLGSQHLANFDPNVRDLSLARSSVGNDILSILSTWPRLSHLNMESCEATNADLKTIGTLVDLSSLNLNSTAINDEGLWHLRSLTDLTVLELNDTRVTQASLPVILGFTELRRLELPFVPDPESLLQLLAACPNLNELLCFKTAHKQRLFPGYYHLDSDFAIHSGDGIWLGAEVFTPQQLERLLNICQVCKLSGQALDDSHCELIKNTTSLIDFSGSRITDAGVAKLAERRRWRDLDFSGAQVTAQGIDALRKNGTRVATLRLDSVENAKALIDTIRELKGLTTLSYPLSRLGKADAIAILSWCNDHPFELYDTCNKSGSLSIEEIQWLLGKSKYDTRTTKLHLIGPLIDDAKLSEFTPSHNLQYVTVSDVACNSSRLIEKLVECKSLTQLSLFRVSLDMDAIARLKSLKRLRTLELIDCGLTDAQLPALAELSQLHELVLDSNQIVGEGIEAFQLSRQLEYLSLKVNPLATETHATLRQLAQQLPFLRIER